jgi:hypothetical protein
MDWYLWTADSIEPQRVSRTGLAIFRAMKDIYCIAPQAVHYGCMVDLLGRAGLLSEALMSHK